MARPVPRSEHRSRCPASKLTDAWEDALGSSYGGWLADQAVGQGFNASIRRREFAGLRVVECECDPCGGQRLAPLIQRDTAPFIGVQITRSGSERFHFGDEALAVGAGDLVILTREQPPRFTVMERLHKVLLVLPWADLQELLPRASHFTGTVLDSRHGIGAMLLSHVDHLARQMEVFTDDDQAAVRLATLELLDAAVIHRVEVPQRGLAQRYLRQLQDYILRHLRDDTLSPGSIAAANHMSPRYVHMLFAQSGTSVLPGFGCRGWGAGGKRCKAARTRAAAWPTSPTPGALAILRISRASSSGSTASAPATAARKPRASAVESSRGQDCSSLDLKIRGRWNADKKAHTVAAQAGAKPNVPA